MHDRDGSILVLKMAVIAVCSGHVTAIEMVGQLGKETEPNPKIGLWKSKTPITGEGTLDFLHPGDGWITERQPTSFKLNGIHIISDVRPGDADKPVLSDGAFTVEQRKKLSPQKVLIVDGIDTNDQVPRATFGDDTCGGSSDSARKE